MPGNDQLEVQGDLPEQVQISHIAPTAQAQNIGVTEDGHVAIVLSAADPDTPQNALTFTILSLPEIGVLTDSAGNVVQLGATLSGPLTLVYEPGAAREGDGNDSFAFQVSDPDGQVSEPATVAITITKAVADGAVTMDAAGTVRIGGTAADDAILLTRTADGQNLKVIINNVVVSESLALAGITEVRAWGRNGNDEIAMVDLALMSLLHGGAGNDRLTGGAGHDLMFGGWGDDDLTGGAGNDLLIGGAGADRIIGSAGHDVLVAGDVGERLTDAVLREISRAWAADRIADDGLADDVLDETTLATGIDMLTGSSGADWFIVNQFDKITDFNAQKKDGDLVTWV